MSSGDRTALAKNITAIASSLSTTDLGDPARESLLMLQRYSVRFRAFTGGANATLAAAANTAETEAYTVYENRYSGPVVVKDIVLTADTAKTASDATYVTVTLTGKYPNNTNSGVIATFNTKATGGIGNVAAFVRLNVTTAINTQAALVPVGGTITVLATKASTGVDISDMSMAIVIEAQ